MSLNCPNCHSEKTQKCSVIWAGGTTDTKSESTLMGAGFGSEGLVPAIGSSSSKGSHQTKLAEQLSPPAKESPVGLVFGGIGCLAPIAGGVLAFITLMLTGSQGVAMVVFALTAVFFALGSVLSAVDAYRRNRDVWPNLQAEWEGKWYCHRCGTTFSPETDKASGAVPSMDAVPKEPTC